MLGLAVAFVAGNLGALFCPAGPPVVAAVVAVLLALPLLFVSRLRAVACLVLGWSLAVVALDAHRAGMQVDEERVLAEVEIAGLPQFAGAATHVDAWLQVPRDPAHLRQFVRLAWPGPAGREMRAGERWQLLVRLRAPDGGCNPDAVDTARNALRDHVQAFASVMASPLNQRIATAPASLLSLRERIALSIHEKVADPAAAALLAALAVGATPDVTREQWRIFNATGITHLVAISGSHVTAFALVAMGLARRGWRLAARHGLRWRRERIVAVVASLLATGYAFLAGLGVPTQRTLMMLVAFLLLRESGRVVQPGTPLGLAAVVIVILDPFCTLSAGFWLSFLAVGAILALAGGRLLPEGGLRAGVTVQGAVFVALLPVTFLLFGSVSLAGLVVNVLAIPLFGIVLVPLVLAATAVWLLLPLGLADPIAGLLLRPAAYAAAESMRILAAAADTTGALWSVSPPLWWYALAAVAIPCVLAPWSLRLRVAGTCVLLPLVGAVDRPVAQDLRLTLFDSGAATSVLLETAHHRVLYGLGEGFRSQGSQVERTLLPALIARGMTGLDAIVLPVLDRDAGAGVTALLARLSAEHVLAARTVGLLPPDVRDCEGWRLDADGWRFEAIDLAGSGCAVRVRGSGGTVVLADRLAAASEQPLAERWPDPVDVWLVPRHGAAIASGPALLSALRPRLALASLRSASREAEPLREVMARYAAIGTAWLDTAAAGAITLRLPASGPRQTSVCRAGRIGAWAAGAPGGKSPGP